MSRREDRNSDSKRHRSRFDLEPSPKRSRRDGKPETERSPADTDVDKDKLDRDQKHHRRLQDAVPLEAPVTQDHRAEAGTMGKESEHTDSRRHEGTRHPLGPTTIPRSQSYFQHDDRGDAGQRSFNRRTSTERGWWRDSKDQQDDQTGNRKAVSDSSQKDEKAKWRHDGYYKLEDTKPPLRKRPSFREQKVPTDPDQKATADPVVPNPRSHPIEDERRDGRDHNSHHSNKPPFVGDRDTNRSDAWRNNFSSRDRYGAGGRYGGRDRFNGRQGYRPSGGHTEKWKHDLYDEANRSPTPKNEEDQLAKIEALLSS